MKKLKIYILALLVPILVMGCVEKGKPSVNVDVDIDNPYNFEQLKLMIDDPDEIYERARLQSNRKDLEAMKLKPDISQNAFGIKKIEELRDYLLNNVYLPILGESSTFKYTTTVADVKKMDEDLTGMLNIKSMTDVTAIKEEIGNVWVNNQNDVLLTSIYERINSIASYLDVRKKKNPYYASTYDLYLAYNILTSDLEKNKLLSYGIDINKIDQKTNIKVALDVLNVEITNLSTNSIAKKSYQNLTLVLGNLNKLKVEYENYLLGKQSYVNVQSMRLILKNNEDSLLTAPAPGSSGVPDLSYLYSLKIDTLYSNLVNLDTGTDSYKTEKKLLYISRIEKYKQRNNEFDKKNYLVIHSKITNIFEEVEYFNAQNVYAELGINPGF